MKRVGYFLLPLMLVGCQACLDEDELSPLECRPGGWQLGAHEGAILSSLTSNDPPKNSVG